MLVYVESWNTGETRTTRSIRSHRVSLAAAAARTTATTSTTATQLRGGDNEELCNDQELDAYIDFLLAEAENEAVKNPFAPLQETDVVTSSSSTTTQQQYDESSSSSSREQDAAASNSFNLPETEETESPIAVDEEMELDHDATGDSDSLVDQPNEEDPREEEVQNIVEDVLVVVQDSSVKEKEELLQGETSTSTTATEQPEFFLGPSAVEQVHPPFETPATTNDTTTHREEIQEEAAAAITAATAEENEMKDSKPSLWTNLVQRVSKSPDKEQTAVSIILDNDVDDVDDDVEQASIMAADVLTTDDVSSSLPPESESNNMDPSESQIQEQQQEPEEELVLGDDDKGMQDKQLLPLLDEEEEEATIELEDITEDKLLEEESSPIELEMEEDYNVDDEILEDPKKESSTPTTCTQAEPVAAKETLKEASERTLSIEKPLFLTLEPEMINTNDNTSIDPADDDESTEHAAKPSISIWQRLVKLSLEVIDDDTTSGNKSEETGATESSLENGDATIEMETSATVGNVVDEMTPLRSPTFFASKMLWTMRDRYNRGWGTLQNFVTKKSGDSESKEVANAATYSAPEEKPARDYSKIYVKYFETTQSTNLPGATRGDSMPGATSDPAKDHSGRGWGSWGRKLAFFSKGSSKGDDDCQKPEDAEIEPSNLDPPIEFEANNEEDPMARIDESTSATVEEEVKEDGPSSSDLFVVSEYDVDGSTLAEYVDEFDNTEGVEEGSSLQVDQRETVVIEEDPNFEEEILEEGTTDPSPETVEEDSQQSAPMRQWILTLEREEDSSQDPAREQTDDLLQLSDQVEKDESMYKEISEQTEESSAPTLEADVIDWEEDSDGPEADDRPIDRIKESSKPPAPTRKWVLTLERAQHSDIVREKESSEDTNESDDIEKTSIIEEIINDVENLSNTEIEDEEDVSMGGGLVEGSESTEIGEEEDSLVVEGGLAGMDRSIQFEEEDDDDIHLLLEQNDDADDSIDENDELNSDHALGNDFASFLPTEIDNDHSTVSDYSLPAVGTLAEVHTSDEMDAIELPIDSEVEEVATFEVSSTSVGLSHTSEGESLNVFSRFLVKHGLESLLMVTIVFIEWFKVYLYPPVFELLDWVFQKQPPPLFHHDSLLSKFLGTRGGANEAPSNEDAVENVYVDESDQNDLAMGSNRLPGERDGDQVEELGSVAESENEDSEITKTVDEKAPEEEPDEADSNYTESTSSLPARARPNLMYRYLLGYGQVGHSLIMVSVFGIEWVYTYLPILASLLDVCKHQVLQGKYGLRREEKAIVSQTTGFVDESGSAVRGGKKRKAQTRKDDQRALSQLQQIGDVSQARYRFVSDHFMRQHAIGPYAGATALVEVEEILEKPYRHSEESDGDWVIEALTQKDPEQSSIDTSVGVSYGSDGASLSVGVELDFGGKRKKQKKRPSISEVARQTSASSKSKSKRPTGPRVSDRESGVMGRIRAAGANSLVGRSLLGAYPGDAPAPVDAADANGMFDVAMKYGYGDWSDGDDEHTAKSRHRRKRRKTSSGARGTRERSSSIGIDFELGSSSSSSSRKTPTSPARYKTKSTSELQSELKSGKSRHRKKRRTKPMELQNEYADGSTVVGPALDFLNETAEAKSNDGSSESTKVRQTRNIKRSPQESPNKNKVVGPAIDMLEKAVAPKSNPETNN